MPGLSLDRLISIANAVYVGSVVVAAIATFAIYYISQAISYRDSIEKEALRETIELAKSDAVKANERAAKLENQAAALRADNLSLENQIAPRRLSREQIDELAKVFQANHGKTAIVSSYAMDLEAASVGDQIMQSARWANFDMVDSRMSISSLGSIMWGIGVTRDDQVFVTALMKTLNSFGMRASIQAPPAGAAFSVVEETPRAQARIFIGVKPLPN
jgi:hypothetical protein